jgi:chromosome segregation ATPase
LNESIAKWLSQLNHVNSELRALNGSSEDEFLRLGAELQNFYGDSQVILKLSAAVAEQLAGEHIAGAISGLQHLLNEFESQLHHSETASDRSHSSLLEISNTLNQIHSSLSGFKRIVRGLNILGITVRIESAYLPGRQNDFSILAGEVKDLAAVIDDKTENILEQSLPLSRKIQSASGAVFTLQKRQHEQLASIGDKTRASLQRLIAKQQHSQQSAQEISKNSNDLYRRTGEAVTAMQFHDITRQQVEHVVKVLEELIFNVNSDGGDEVSAATRISDLCDLQQAQLGQAKRSLLSAVETIFGHLGELVKNANSFSEATQTLTGASGGDHASFLTTMETDMQSTSEVLSQNAEAGRETAQTIRSVSSTVGSITSFLRDIEKIGAAIEIISINSIVKASHIGRIGVTLSVLAQSIRDLSLDTHSEIQLVSEKLKRIGALTEDLNSAIAHEFENRDAQIVTLVTELRDWLKQLRAVNGEIVNTLVQLNNRTQKLAADMEKSRENFKVHNRFAETIDNATAVLRQVVAEVAPMLPQRSYDETQNSLRNLEHHYTMESERDIHRTRTQSTSTTEAAAVTVEIGSASELGDNIELF